MAGQFLLNRYETEVFSTAAIEPERWSALFSALSQLDFLLLRWDLQLVLQDSQSAQHAFVLRTDASIVQNVRAACYLQALQLEINRLGWGMSRTHPREDEWVVLIGQPLRAPRLGEVQWTRTLSFSDYVFIKNRHHPAKEEDLEALGLADLFYQLAFVRDLKGERFAWQFVLQPDTIEFFRLGMYRPSVVEEAGALVCGFAHWMREAGRKFSWRLDPRPEKEPFYLGMARLDEQSATRFRTLRFENKFA